MNVVQHVVALIHLEDGVYGASFPDVPGCVTTSETIDELMARAELALALHIDGLQEDGLAPPRFRSIAEIKSDPDWAPDLADATLAVIPFAPRGRSVRVNITMDEWLLAALDQAARARRTTRSAFLSQAARERLAREDAH